MINLILGISLTLNVITIVGIIIYLKIQAYGIKKVQKDFANKFFVSNDELDDMLDKL